MHEHSELAHELVHALLHAVEIGLFVFLMMLVVDYFNVWTQGRLTAALQGRQNRQYLLASVLGVLPGCLGSFLVVTMYIRGMLGFGALLGNFVATSGDAAFFMLAEIPKTALILFGILFLLGVVVAWVGDKIAKGLGIAPCAECRQAAHHMDEADCRVWPDQGMRRQWVRPHPLRLLYLAVMLASAGLLAAGVVGPERWNWIRVAVLILLGIGAVVIVTVPDHYLREHIVHHITLHHLPRIFAWTLGTLFVLTVCEHWVDLKEVVSGHLLWVLLLAGLVGILPDSGPHFIFVILFAQGTVPLSVLLTSSIVQDGHGMLPLLSVSVKDSLMVKLFNLALGLMVGLGVYLAGY